ncbi:hypothetical protein PPYR_09022 [Photinus pyralis]|uniref:Serpin domain-containing protein n=1 Tax=Photinus pyralis TaxID=7054 RepID=A0A1Y1L4Z8_PHOPY|nr:serine protease inhibitor 88Ea-like isoform X2 [Photinus pyralis]XP_031343684.1 serine protease inhibitor 88Ea-like isoform X2 [Photinus pyralis]KAB0797094.1 hypothetical protein PPYR_08088 [Photinus pyralis]KAB0798029.1 hypothetical protein PPYR_09022 [Photinus pyralis]
MKIALVLFCSILLRSSYQQCLTHNDLKPPHPSGRLLLYSGQQEFSLALLQAINKVTPSGNIFFSPYSTYHALLIAYFLSSHHTEKFLRKTLRLDSSQDKADLFSAYKLDRFTTTMRALNSSYEFTNANRIYVAQQIRLRDCVTNVFAEELFQKDFKSNPERARTEINAWVEQHTHDMIKDLLPAGTIDAATNLVLVNAAYFKGQWESKFDPKDTKPEVFFISPSKQIIVDMMHIETGFNYDVSETLMAHILEMPYEGDDISMYILLPPFSKEDGVETVLKRLTLDTFRSVVNESMIARQVKVSLPKFRLEHTVELTPVLEKIGVGDLFQSTANFSVLTDEKVSLGRGLHKARIEVTEEGTKAAAATVLFTFRSSRPLEPAIFNCNHPFVYLIYSKVEQAILFTGIFRRPY